MASFLWRGPFLGKAQLNQFKVNQESKGIKETLQKKIEFEPNPPDTPRARTTHLQRIPMMMERPCITWKLLDQFAAKGAISGLFGVGCVGGPSRIASTLRAILKIGGLDNCDQRWPEMTRGDHLAKDYNSCTEDEHLALCALQTQTDPDWPRLSPRMLCLEWLGQMIPRLVQQDRDNIIQKSRTCAGCLVQHSTVGVVWKEGTGTQTLRVFIILTTNIAILHSEVYPIFRQTRQCGQSHSQNESVCDDPPLAKMGLPERQVQKVLHAGPTRVRICENIGLWECYKI